MNEVEESRKGVKSPVAQRRKKSHVKIYHNPRIAYINELNQKKKAFPFETNTENAISQHLLL